MEYVDRRTIPVVAFAQGAAEVRPIVTSLAAENPTQRLDDILGMRPDAHLVRAANVGIDRRSGGAYEIPYLALVVFGSDGRVTRFERFDADAEALARFDELAPAPSRPVRRRLRANAVTENADGVVAAVRARDVDAFRSLFSDDFEVVDHSTGAAYGRDGAVASALMVIEDRGLPAASPRDTRRSPRPVVQHRLLERRAARRDGRRALRV